MLEEKEALALKCQSEYEGARKLQEIQTKIDDFEPMLGWAMVAEKERERDAAAKDAKDAADAATIAERLVYEKDNENKELESSGAQKEKEVSAAQRELDRFRARAEKDQKPAMTKKAEVKRLKQNIANLTYDLTEAREHAETCQAEHEKAQAALEGSMSNAQLQQKANRAAPRGGRPAP